MRGVIFEALGAEPKIVDDLENPKPGPGQVLVKSLWTAMNPVDAFMSTSGILVQSWPLVLAVDASGIIVQSTPEAESKYNLRVGDYVCGCTRLGMAEYASGQDFFLMDANVTIPKPKNLDLKQAATLGVGIETAALGVFEGLGIDFGLLEAGGDRGGEWAVVLGGASSVGWFAVQLLKAAGYQVLTSRGKRSAGLVESLGVKTLNYSISLEEQVKTVLEITGGNIVGIFDAVAANDPVLVKELFKADGYKSGRKYFSTTNDWAGIEDFEGGKTYHVELGPIGRTEAKELNGALERYIPVLVKLVEKGTIVTGEYEVIGDGGYESLVEGYKLKSGGGGGSKKLVVKVQDE